MASFTKSDGYKVVMDDEKVMGHKVVMDDEKVMVMHELK
jgi:hypothetical protein